MGQPLTCGHPVLIVHVLQRKEIYEERHTHRQTDRPGEGARADSEMPAPPSTSPSFLVTSCPDLQGSKFTNEPHATCTLTHPSVEGNHGDEAKDRNQAGTPARYVDAAYHAQVWGHSQGEIPCDAG